MLRSGRGHRDDFGPLRVGINDDEEHLPVERSREVHVHSLPGGVWPYPWVQWSSWRSDLQGLTHGTGLCEVFNVAVQPTPPKIAPGNRLHPSDSGVVFVEGLQYLGLPLFRDENTNSPQKTTALRPNFVLSCLVRFQ